MRGWLAYSAGPFRSASRFRQIALWVAASCLLLAGVSSCGLADPATRAADDYLARVQRVMRSPAPPPLDVPSIPRWPRHRALAVPVPEIHIDLADFIGLHRCDAGRLVGLRNGPLGRVMPASERLTYEIDLVVLLEHCRVLRSIPDHPIHDWIKQKRSALPLMFWNAVMAGPEMRAAWSATQAPNPPDAAHYHSDREAIAALHALAELRAALGRVPLAPLKLDLTATLDALRRARFAGLLRAAALQERALRRVRAALLGGDPPCPFGRPTPRGRILETVLFEVYGDRFQPWLSATRRDLAELRGVFAGLARITEEEQTEAFRAWYAAVFEDGVGARFEARISDHTSAWREVLSECAMLPGRDASRASGVRLSSHGAAAARAGELAEWSTASYSYWWSRRFGATWS